ncbi:hypothetical protein C8R47DRAFT_58574 [Mycena vitilis]|nr:hypothetical protein C8R47DRAFT_58574 [Mycena vitilis]
MVALARGVNAAVDGAGGGGFAAAASGSTATSASSTPVPNSVSLPTTCSARVSPSTSMGMAIPASLSAIFEPPAGSAPNARASFSPSYAFPPSSAAPSSSAVPDTEHADADADTDTEDADADADDTPPCAACAARSEGDAYLGGLGVISSAGAGAGAGASPKDADAAGEWAARACGGFVCDVGVGVGVDVDGVHVDAEVDDLRSFGGQEPDQQGEGQEPEEHRNGASPAGGEGEGEGGEGTHILLIAPGAHTLAERYLASFGFPAVPSYSSEEGGGGPRFELGDPLVRASTSDGVADGAGGANVKDEGEKEKGEEKARDGEDGEKETEKGGNREKRPRNPIASIRLFVDPRPAEGVYAALGMGWAAARPGASPAPSPAASPVIPGAGAGVGGPGMSRTVSSPGVGIRFGVAGGGGGVLPRSTSLGMAASTAQDPPTSPPSAQGTTDPLSQVQDPHASPASYVTHGVLSGIGAVVMRALRAGMPVWERGGDVRLLGGEFVFEWGPTRTPGTATSPPLSQPGSLSDDPHQTSRDARRVSGSFGRASLPRAVSTSVIPRAVSTSVLPRAAASSVIVTASASTDSSEREHERERAVVPRSASTPPASGMFFLGSGRSRNIFQRFAGPRGARERRGREEREREQGRAQDGGKEKVKDDAIKPRDAPSIRERPSIPRSASTPPGKAGALWGQHHGWAHVPRWGAGTDVGVIWEGDDAGVDEEADNADESGRDREPVMRATLSASSSRPWALVASGSSASLVSEVSEFVAKEGTGQVSNREPSTSGSSVALSMSLRSNNVSASSASTSELEETFPSPYHPYLAGQHAPRVYVAEEEGTEGDDERSGSEETSRRVYPFPRAGVPHARPKSEYTPAPAAAVAPVQPRPVSALVRAKWTYGRGHSRARSEQSSYASHGRAEDGEEGEEGEYAYARGYGGDGYGSSVDGEDVWMRARAQSLARLKARKEVRRGGG